MMPPNRRTLDALQALADADAPMTSAAIAEAIGESEQHGVNHVSALLAHAHKYGRVECVTEKRGTIGATWRITPAGREWLADTLAEQPHESAAVAKPRAMPARNSGVPEGAGTRTHRIKSARELPPMFRNGTPVAAPRIEPPGSTAIADDGTVLLLDGDRVAARLSPRQVANIVALAARYQERM
jgi:DNA-binding PadR family transcriptional regulator